MRAISAFKSIFLYNGFVDFRRRRKSLAVLVQTVLNHDPFSKALFLFCNRQRTCVRMVYWDGNGFAMWEKELEEEKFAWLKNRDGNLLSIEAQQLEWLLSGIDIWKLKLHKELNYETLV